MEIRKKLAVIEAVLFASGEPVKAKKIAGVAEIDLNKLSEYINLLNNRYDEYHSGIKIISINDSYQMTTKEEYADAVREVLESKKSVPLSNASMETLTIIAYNQPVSKSFVENIRGTDSSATINNLSQRGLIEEAGRLDVPGKPVIYKTTDTFLRCFGLRSLDELPPLPDRNNLDIK